ncbi:hypothetical protein TrLO_g12051 [Triparma laevis f. longispina]|uniref:Uncharacterized protein n=1 Tax=Triparma laevis f. longispina TaxID=1714387 RepID=A0A9W7ASF1_9STRA|nr:hypothetical protein TrLO_g12051 [Triparma laevis f. longispina]
MFALLGFSVRLAESACDPSLPCWPTESEISALTTVLDPKADRSSLLRTNPVKGGTASAMRNENERR